MHRSKYGKGESIVTISQVVQRSRAVGDALNKNMTASELEDIVKAKCVSLMQDIPYAKALVEKPWRQHCQDRVRLRIYIYFRIRCYSLTIFTAALRS
jgi:hypothetical protein